MLHQNFPLIKLRTSCDNKIHVPPTYRKRVLEKKETPKQLAQEKYKKRLEEFKVRWLVRLTDSSLDSRVEPLKLNTIGSPAEIQKIKEKKKGKKFIHENKVIHDGESRVVFTLGGKLISNNGRGERSA